MYYDDPWEVLLVLDAESTGSESEQARSVAVG